MTRPIGGNLANSFLSKMVFVPYAGNQTFTKLSAISAGTSFSFDVITAQPKTLRHLDNATHSGYWFSRGRRETARDSEMAMRLKWDIDYPAERQIGFYQALQGFQVYAIMGSNAQTESTAVYQYYWNPSMFVAPLTNFIDVGSTPPKLIELDILLEPNGPSFFVDDSAGATYDSQPIADFCAYITARGEGF